jgi:hypothetical protein
MSVGYYNPHTINEYTVIEDMFYAAQLISNMINGLGNSKYEHKSEMNGSFGYRGYSSFKYDKYDDYYNDNRHDDYDNYDDYYGRKIPVNRCSCVDSETVNVDCLICNPIYTKHSNKICQCGEELVEHMYSYHCDYCSRVYIKF